MKTWLIYVRKSVVRDGTDLESPERQLYVCQTRLELQETDPYETEIYQDLDCSGSNEAGRPEWLLLKEQLARPEVVGIISSSLDRLYRNVSEFLEFLNTIEKSNKILITAKESLDTSSPLGRFVVTILMALFEMEWRLTSQRMTEMIVHKRTQQGRHWGPVPFGCERDDKGQLIPSQQTYTTEGETRYVYDTLTECFRIFSSGSYTYEATSNRLNAAGWFYIDRYGSLKPFNKEVVREVLARWRIYKGDLPLGNSRKSRDVEWIEGGHDPILPVELCEAVAYQLERRNKPFKARSANRIYLLSGLLYCPCGIKLTGQKAPNTRAGYYYRHSRSASDCEEPWIPASQIEQDAINALIEIVHHPTLLADIQDNLNELTAPKTSDLDTFKKRQKVKEDLDRLEDIYLDSRQLSKSKYIKRRGELLTHLTQLDLELNSPQSDIHEVILDVQSSLHLIAHAQPETQRELFTTLFERIEVKERKIGKVWPQGWAKPFFSVCQEWAGWESNPHGVTSPGGF